MQRDRIFVERTYQLVTEAGEMREVRLRIGAPEPDGRVGFFCPIEISGLDVPAAHGAYGVDEIHALRLSLHQAHIILRYSNEYRAGRLGFLGAKDLDLPGLDHLEGVRFDCLFHDEGSFATLLGALLVSTSPFACRFREALSKPLGLSMGQPPVDTYVGSAIGFASAKVASTLDIIAHPDARTVLAIGLALRGEQPRFEAIEEGYRRLRAEEDEAARLAGRPARRIQTVIIAPDGTAPSHDPAEKSDTWQLLEWRALFGIFEWCQVAEGHLIEPVLPALCRGATSTFDMLARSGPRQWSPTVPDRERIWAALQAAADEFRRACTSDPALKAITWEPEAYRSDRSDTISGSFRPGNPPPRFRRLSLIGEPGQGTRPFKVRLEVCASRDKPGDSKAWEARRRELHESARTLSWLNAYRSDQPDAVRHELDADLSGPEVSACGRPLEHVLNEGLLAYARAFRWYLAREN